MTSTLAPASMTSSDHSTAAFGQPYCFEPDDKVVKKIFGNYEFNLCKPVDKKLQWLMFQGGANFPGCQTEKEMKTLVYILTTRSATPLNQIVQEILIEIRKLDGGVGHLKHCGRMYGKTRSRLGLNR